LPFGTASGLSNPAGVHYLPELSLGRHFGGFRLALSAQALLRQSGEGSLDLSTLPEGRELRFGAVAATDGSRFRWEVNALGTVPLNDQPRSMELLMGPRFLAHSSVELFAMGGVGLGAAPGTPLFRVMVGSAWGGVTPPRLASVSGRCAPDEKHTARECPESDEDKDGVPNGLDRCPYEMGSLEFSGCPIRDSDGDGIEDSLDVCPQEPGPAEGKGCALPDDDGDGVDNTRDVCPTEAGAPEARGCPRRAWSEQDLKEQEAICARYKGKRNRLGCDDRDGDGIANRFDSCPRVRGPVVNHGCPAEESPLVTLTRSRLELREKIFFVPSQAQLEARSQPQLDWVVETLQEHPEFTLVEVGAHTDNRSFSEANLDLSQGRAEAVRNYLIQKGVAPARLRARGYGDSVPIDSNDTSIGRENNRRVEFIIIGPK
ncbi:MAG: OmpA family protein, partial [Cystobacter sp.]